MICNLIVFCSDAPITPGVLDKKAYHPCGTIMPEFSTSEDSGQLIGKSTFPVFCSKIEHSVYFYLTTISAILYVAVLFGSFHFAPEYLIYITSIIKIYIALMLIYRFNPLTKKTSLSSDDKKMVFSSGVYLLLTTTIGDYLVTYKDKIENKFKNVLANK